MVRGASVKWRPLLSAVVHRVLSASRPKCRIQEEEGRQACVYHCLSEEALRTESLEIAWIREHILLNRRIHRRIL
jgi:hypothetical protein